MKRNKHMTALLMAGAMLLALTACGQSMAADTGPAEQPQPLAMETSPGSSFFTDVPAGADYADAVAWCREQGLMHGTSATEFSPNATLTRAMVVTVLYRAEGEPEVNGDLNFTDIQSGQWCANAVLWANAQGIAQGYGNGLFGTNDPITRAQLDVILRRYRKPCLERQPRSGRPRHTG